MLLLCKCFYYANANEWASVYISNRATHKQLCCVLHQIIQHLNPPKHLL